MADTASKIDAAAEKAFAEASEKKTAEAASAKPGEAVEASSAVAPNRAKASAKKASPKKAAAKKTTKPAVAKKASVKTKRAAKRPAAKKTAPKPTPIAKLKDTIMATAKSANTNDFTKTAKEAAAELQTRAKAAYDKGAELTAEAGDFHKGNFEALVESGKILTAGMQDMGRTYVEDAKGAVETVQADVKKIAAIKSPTELFQLQGEIARRNFDAVVAATSKNSEAFLKLAGEAFAPVSSRMSMAAEKISKAA